jgi:hypothetical protein
MSIDFKFVFGKFMGVFITLLFRGAGQEVGRSCIMLEFKGKKIMVNKRVFVVQSLILIECGHFIDYVFDFLAGLWNSSRFIGNGCTAFR